MTLDSPLLNERGSVSRPSLDLVYVTSDVREHTTGHLLAEILPAHRPDQLETQVDVFLNPSASLILSVCFIFMLELEL